MRKTISKIITSPVNYLELDSIKREECACPKTIGILLQGRRCWGSLYTFLEECERNKAISMGANGEIK